MSIKGFNIGGSIERVDYEGLDNKPNIPDVLTAFKEKEIDYTTIYSYDTEDLKNRTTHKLGQPIYEVEAYKNTEGYGVEGRVKFHLNTAYKDDNGNIGYYVDTPLKAVFGDEGKMIFENFAKLYDIGLIVDGKAYPLSKFLGTLMDGTGTFHYGKIHFQYSWDNANLKLTGIFDVVSEYEQAIDQLLTEVQGLLSLYGDTLLIYYKNLPEIETIQAQYIGG